MMAVTTFGGLARGAAVAALGPLFPAAGMVGGLAADIFGLGKGIVSKGRDRKQRRAVSSLSPSAYPFSEEIAEKIKTERGKGAHLPKMQQLGTGDEVVSSRKKVKRGKPGIVGRAATAIFGLGKGLAQKVAVRRKRRVADPLVPFSEKIVEKKQTERGKRAHLPKIQRLGKGGTVSSQMRQIEAKQSKAGVGILSTFFNKTAYRTKWTKELLNQTKKANKRKEASVHGLGAMFSSLSSAILPLVGKAGLFAGLAGSIVLAGDRISKSVAGWKELISVNAENRKAVAESTRTVTEIFDAVKKIGGLEAYSKSVGKTPAQVIGRISGLETKVSELNRSSQSLWKQATKAILKTMPIAYVLGLNKKAKVVSQSNRVEEIKEELMPADVTRDQTLYPRLDPKVLEEVTKALSAMGTVSEDLRTYTLELDKKSSVNIKEPSIGDPNDHADAFIKDYSAGKLSR